MDYVNKGGGAARVAGAPGWCACLLIRAPIWYSNSAARSLLLGQLSNGRQQLSRLRRLERREPARGLPGSPTSGRARGGQVCPADGARLCRRCHSKLSSRCLRQTSSSCSSSSWSAPFVFIKLGASSGLRRAKHPSWTEARIYLAPVAIEWPWSAHRLHRLIGRRARAGPSIQIYRCAATGWIGFFLTWRVPIARKPGACHRSGKKWAQPVQKTTNWRGTPLGRTRTRAGRAYSGPVGATSGRAHTCPPPGAQPGISRAGRLITGREGSHSG